MATIYESPDRGKTIYARPVNDYKEHRPVTPPRQAPRDAPPALAEAAARFVRIERQPTTPAAAAAERERAKAEC